MLQDVDRGTCPACGSAEVVVVVHGLPADPTLADRPDVRLAGCLVVGEPHDRECAQCGTSWSSPEPADAPD
jgi:RNA polymerase subunit RPABC4/transcription elongation factor Spt4